MANIKFLYWNTANKGFTQEKVLNALFRTRQPADVLLLGECPSGLTTGFLARWGLLELLIQTKSGQSLQQRVYYQPAKLGLTLAAPVPVVKQVQSTVLATQPFGDDYEETVRRLRIRITRLVQMQLVVNGQAYLLASVHFPSKLAQDEVSQLQIAHSYKAKLLTTATNQAATYHNRIIVVGDFNMNPFDAGMVEPLGFHALGNREQANPNTERHYDKTPIFYNPCWSLLGDYHPTHVDRRTGGSFYYAKSASRRLFWHLFDQVIVSRELAGSFVPSSLSLVEVPTLRREMLSGIERQKAQFADHFPLTFTLIL
ncbi:MAG: hypothetical protein EOO60_01370 [Hymenobacter sp.]|nr:MAG: hypothetical protein EOO60_01370 [Hymenobacter sp.]